MPAHIVIKLAIFAVILWAFLLAVIIGYIAWGHRDRH